MLAGMISGAALVVAMLLLSRLRSDQAEQRRATLAWSITALAVAAAILVTAFTLPGRNGVDPGGPGTLFGATSISRADVARISSRLSAGATEAPASMQVASVPSLIGGLEQRLEENPADEAGWALLAQSYAFVGEPQNAEQALLRAVELGFDEAELRQRIASAVPDPHAGLRGIGSTQP